MWWEKACPGHKKQRKTLTGMLWFRTTNSCNEHTATLLLTDHTPPRSCSAVVLDNPTLSKSQIFPCEFAGDPLVKHQICRYKRPATKNDGQSIFLLLLNSIRFFQSKSVVSSLRHLHIPIAGGSSGGLCIQKISCCKQRITTRIF